MQEDSSQIPSISSPQLNDSAPPTEPNKSISHDKISKNILKASIVTTVFLILATVVGIFLKPKTEPISQQAWQNAISSLNSLETISFTEDKSVFVNPEKGFYYGSKDTSISGLTSTRSNGMSLNLMEVDLGEFKTGPISDAKLALISNTFTIARKNGIKIIFRAAYSYTSSGVAPEPPDEAVMLKHIAQLKPIFAANEDVLYSVQAGFLGTWGEWHSTIYGPTPYLYNDIPTQVQKDVVKALLDAIPKSRTVQLRRPRFIRSVNDNISITAVTAHNGSDISRIGYHNDCLLADGSDYGTYDDSSAKYNSRTLELAWIDSQMKYVPFGGETCAVSSYNDAPAAIAEFSKLHIQYLNSQYNVDVLNKWNKISYNGENSKDYITRNMGYKFLLSDIQLSSKVYSGGVMRLKLDISNAGFGNLVNERNMEIVLSNGVDTYKTTFNEDMRNWYRENGLMTKDLYISIPSNVKAGSYNIYLNFPDKSASLISNPSYSIRLANSGVWDADKGYNLIKKNLVIDDGGVTNSNTFMVVNRAVAESLMGIAVEIPVTSVSLDRPKGTVEIGQTITLIPTVMPATVLEKGVTFVSSDESVATVDNTGKVTPVSPGVVTITATTISGGKTAISTITVVATVVTDTVVPVSSVKLVPSSINLINGSTAKLIATVLPINATDASLSYVSANPTIVSIEKNGLITAHSPGNTTIRVTSIGSGKTSELPVLVTQPVVSVSMPVASLSIAIGTTYSLTGSVAPSTATNSALKYKSSDYTIVSIDDKGMITAVSPGQITITATSVDGNKTATSIITVTQNTPIVINNWSKIDSIAQNLVGRANTLKIYNNQSTLYLLVNGSELNTKSQFYLDTDNNSGTGFKTSWSKSGIEFLIENKYLYKYSGNYNSWKWTQVGSVSMTRKDNIVGIAVPLSSMKLSVNDKIHIGFISNDSSTSVLPVRSMAIPGYVLGTSVDAISF